MTEAGLRRRLAREIRKAGSRAMVARQYGLSPQFLGQMVNGHTPITAKLAKAMGYGRRYEYYRLSDA